MKLSVTNYYQLLIRRKSGRVPITPGCKNLENQNESRVLARKSAPKEPRQSCTRRFSQLIAEWRNICKLNENEDADACYTEQLRGKGKIFTHSGSR